MALSMVHGLWSLDLENKEHEAICSQVPSVSGGPFCLFHHCSPFRSFRFPWPPEPSFCAVVRKGKEGAKETDFIYLSKKE